MVTARSSSPRALPLRHEGAVAPRPAAERIALPAGQVRRLAARGRRPVVVSVAHGTVWLTLTPAAGDTILHGGDRFPITAGWPIVVQALTDAEVEIGDAP